MIQLNSVEAIQGEKIYFRTLKVKRVAADVFQIISFYYGEPEIRYAGYAKDVVKFLNGWFGNPWECENSVCDEMADGPGLCKECHAALMADDSREDWGKGY